MSIQQAALRQLEGAAIRRKPPRLRGTGLRRTVVLLAGAFPVLATTPAPAKDPGAVAARGLLLSHSSAGCVENAAQAGKSVLPCSSALIPSSKSPMANASKA